MTGITAMFFGGTVFAFSGAWNVLSSATAETGAGLALGYDVSGSPYVMMAGNTSGPANTRALRVNTLRASVWTRSLTRPSSGSATCTGATADSSYNTFTISNIATGGGAQEGVVLAKIDTDGALSWQRKLSTGTSPDLNARGVATDSSGNVYAAGYASDGSAGFVAKYNSSGTIQWQRTLTTTDNAFIDSVATDASGNVIVAGHYNFSSANTYAFVAKYNSSGVIQWQKYVDLTASNYNAYIPAVVCDSSDNIYFYMSAEATPGTPYSYYVKLNSSGTMQWTRRITADNTFSKGAAYIDASGYIYFAHEGLDNDGYIVKYDSSGTRQFDVLLSNVTGSCGIVADTAGFMWNLGTVSDATETYYSLTRVPSDVAVSSTFSMVAPYGTITVTTSAPSYTENTTALTIATSSLTDAAGAYTDSAGALTSGTFTATAYTSAG